jgi:ParB-like chromosome segregation protein Spo0J
MGRQRKNDKGAAKGNSRHQPGPAKAAAAGTIAVTMVPTRLLRPSRWNANEMSAEEFAELVNEVGRLGRPPKPIVVRARGKGYEIVDGEHSWRAARACGLEEVPCEVIQADDFEARRQSLTRNRHGTNDPVKLGRLFRHMIAAGGLSGRELGRAINLSEGTVRNFLRYAEAADVRNGYAPGRADGQIAKLGVKQLRRYLELPQGEREGWLDRGASLEEAEHLRPPSPPAGDGQQAVSQTAETPGAGRATESPEVPPARPAVGQAPGAEAPAGTGRQGPPCEDGANGAGGQVEHGSADSEAAAAERMMLNALYDSWGKATEKIRRDFLAVRLTNEPGLSDFVRARLAETKEGPLSVVWRKRRVRPSAPSGRCIYPGKARPGALVPILVRNRCVGDRPRHDYVATLPAIRSCCLNAPLARAQWWCEIEERLVWLMNERHRLDFLDEEGIIHTVTYIEKLLAVTVPLPTPDEWEAFGEMVSERARQEGERLEAEREAERARQRERRRAEEERRHMAQERQRQQEARRRAEEERKQEAERRRIEKERQREAERRAQETRGRRNWKIAWTWARVPSRRRRRRSWGTSSSTPLTSRSACRARRAPCCPSSARTWRGRGCPSTTRRPRPSSPCWD